MVAKYLKTGSTFLLFIIYILFAIASADEQESKSSRVEESKSSRVEGASTQQLEGIKFGLKEGNTLSTLFVVKSKDFSNIYFVGAKINKQIAIWSIGGSKTSPNMYFSVNDYALKISDYPDGRKSKAQIKESDDGVQLLKDYLLDENK